jgi:hypothetical protein
MKTCTLLVAMLFLVGCSSNPPRCGRRLTPINASYRIGLHAGVRGP